MKREILFRGKSSQNDKWLYGNIQIPEAPYDEYFMWDNGWQMQVDVNTVGQYTGLIDKNGKKIFEGDILRVSEYDNLLMREFNDETDYFGMFTLEELTGELQQSYTSPVTWEDGTFCISTKGDWLHHNDMFLAVLFGDMKRSNPIFIFEVIGNIHDNPELLKYKT
jgi:hypothetical protein